MRGFRRSICSLAALIAAAPGVVAAQVALDGTFGASGVLNGPDTRVPEAVGQRVGPNLFHSFRAFGVPEDGSVTFEGDAALRAIVGRVSGGGESRIDGLLASEAPNADLYLINPAGVIFGEGAELDLPGSLHVSTADSVGFANGERFAANKISVPPKDQERMSPVEISPISANGRITSRRRMP